MIESMRIANLGPFRGVQELTLSEGLLSIEGRYVGKKGKSNRAGKSFFAVDLLRYLLYGKHRFTQTAKIVHRNADLRTDPCYGAVSLSLPDDEHISVVRSYDRIVSRFGLELPSLEAKLTEKMKQSELQSLLDSTMGCTAEDAALTWMVMQDNSSGIMDLQVSQRKTFLLTLFSTVQYPWEAYFTETSSRLKQLTGRYYELSNQYTSLVSKRESVNTQSLKAQLQEYAKEKLERQTQRDKITADKVRILEQLKRDDVSVLRQSIQLLDSKVSSAFSVLTITRRQVITAAKNAERLSQSKTELSQVETTYATLSATFDESKLGTVRVGYSQLLKQNQKMNGELAALMDRINNIEQFQGTGRACPVTGKSCPQGADITAYRDSLVKQASQLQAKLNGELAKEQTLSQALSKMEIQLQDLTTLSKQIVGLQEIIASLQSAPTDLAALQQAVVQQEASYTELKNEKILLEKQLQDAQQRGEMQQRRMLEDLDVVYRRLTNEISQIDSNIIAVESELSNLKRLNADFKLVQEEMSRQDTRIQTLKALRPALSKDGIPFFGLVASISEFEAEINRALTNLGTDIRVEIVPYRQLSSLDPLCNACGYEFPNSVKKCPVCGESRQHKREETLEIQFRGSAFNVDFQEDSGGGKLLVSLAIRLALFSVLRERGMMRGIDFWVMDEVFSPLDTAAKASMLQFMDDLRDMYGFKQLFIISHTDLSEVIPPAIIIERNEDTQESVILA